MDDRRSCVRFRVEGLLVHCNSVEGRPWKICFMECECASNGMGVDVLGLQLRQVGWLE